MPAVLVAAWTGSLALPAGAARTVADPGSLALSWPAIHNPRQIRVIGERRGIDQDMVQDENEGPVAPCDNPPV